ncbi:MAG: polyphosphate--glucose phosphotransferase [Acidimicrobiia bacterium]
MAEVLGIDIGGSGIKGAPVDTVTGRLTAERHRIATPQPSVPKAVGRVVARMARHFDRPGPIGCTFPAVVKHGKVLSAANVDQSWMGTDGEKLLSEAAGAPVSLVNDADAAGIAELRIGAGRGREGVVVLLTFGTGIGSAVFVDRLLVPNTELGHLELHGGPAEHYAAARVRREEALSWDDWGERVGEYLRYVERLLSPDLFIVGGGVSRRFGRFSNRLQVGVEVVPAELRNQAGIVGAALVAAELTG